MEMPRSVRKGRIGVLSATQIQLSHLKIEAKPLKNMNSEILIKRTDEVKIIDYKIIIKLQKTFNELKFHVLTVSMFDRQRYIYDWYQLNLTLTWQLIYQKILLSSKNPFNFENGKFLLL